MLVKTKAIVLHSFKYGETSVIARLFTREAGLQSYLVSGVRKSRSRIKQNLFQPLTIVDLVAYQKEKGGLQRIREITCPAPFENIPYDIPKTSIAIFLSEILTKSVKEQEPYPELFDFIFSALDFLDHTKGKVSDFHLIFLLKLSRYLGFYPRTNYDQTHCFFNLKEGMFQKNPCAISLCLDKELSRHFFELAHTGFAEMESLSINPQTRKSLLEKTLDYYRMHLEGFQEVRSHFVLEMVLN